MAAEASAPAEAKPFAVLFVCLGESPPLPSILTSLRFRLRARACELVLGSCARIENLIPVPVALSPRGFGCSLTISVPCCPERDRAC
jgi:hypothetical protein